MKRLSLLLTLGTLVLVGIGCSTSYGQGTVYDRRVPDYRRGDRHQSRYYDRVHHDVREYVRIMDRRLRLDPRQQQRIHHLLDDRAERLLDRTHPRDHAYVYPFPRRLDNRRQNQHLERWWLDADRQIERQLDRYQRDEYRYMTRPYGYRDGRYDRRDGRYDRRDGRYDRRDNGRKRGHQKKRHDDDDDGWNRGDDDDDDGGWNRGDDDDDD